MSRQGAGIVARRPERIIITTIGRACCSWRWCCAWSCLRTNWRTKAGVSARCFVATATISSSCGAAERADSKSQIVSATLSEASRRAGRSAGCPAYSAGVGRRCCTLPVYLSVEGLHTVGEVAVDGLHRGFRCARWPCVGHHHHRGGELLVQFAQHRLAELRQRTRPRLDAELHVPAVVAADLQRALPQNRRERALHLSARCGQQRTQQKAALLYPSRPSTCAFTASRGLCVGGRC